MDINDQNLNLLLTKPDNSIIDCISYKCQEIFIFKIAVVIKKGHPGAAFSYNLLNVLGTECCHHHSFDSMQAVFSFIENDRHFRFKNILGYF